MVLCCVSPYSMPSDSLAHPKDRCLRQLTTTPTTITAYTCACNVQHTGLPHPTAAAALGRPPACLPRGSSGMDLCGQNSHIKASTQQLRNFRRTRLRTHRHTKKSRGSDARSLHARGVVCNELRVFDAMVVRNTDVTCAHLGRISWAVLTFATYQDIMTAD